MFSKRFVVATAALAALVAGCTIEPAVETSPPLENGFFVFANDDSTGLPVEGVVLAASTTTAGVETLSFELDVQGRAYLPLESGVWDLQVLDVNGQLMQCSGPQQVEVNPESVTRIVLGCNYGS